MHNFDSCNWLLNGLLDGTGGTKGSGVSGSVTVSAGTAVASKVARDDQLGSWQQMSLDASDGQMGYVYLSQSVLDLSNYIGRKFYIVVEVDFGSDSTNPQSIKVALEFRTA